MKSSSHPFRSEQARAEYHTLYMERAKKWPVASETRLIETPSGQTFVRVSGRMTDPPLILLPGSREGLDGGAGGLKYGEVEVGQETVIFDSESSPHGGDREIVA